MQSQQRTHRCAPGDAQPLYLLAARLHQAQPQLRIDFATHAAHQVDPNMMISVVKIHQSVVPDRNDEAVLNYAECVCRVRVRHLQEWLPRSSPLHHHWLPQPPARVWGDAASGGRNADLRQALLESCIAAVQSSGSTQHHPRLILCNCFSLEGARWRYVWMVDMPPKIRDILHLLRVCPMPSISNHSLHSSLFLNMPFRPRRLPHRRGAGLPVHRGITMPGAVCGAHVLRAPLQSRLPGAV